MDNPRFSASGVDSGPPATRDGAAFVGLLARMAGADATPASQSLATHLAQWIDWRQAVLLSEALAARPPSSPDAGGAATVDDECIRVRDFLADAIRGDRAFATPRPRPGVADPAAAWAAEMPPADAAFYRQRCVALQQLMEAEIGLLRKRLRDRLARRPGIGRLAAVDAAMERTLAPRERSLLARVPDVLAAHFDRLRAAQANAARSPADPPQPPATPASLIRFRHEMQRLLLAELDFRLQPSEGLLAALRTIDPAHHAE